MPGTETINPRDRTILFILLAILSGFCVIWLAPSPVPASVPPVAPMRYQYETFPWPEGTQTATFYRIREPHQVTVDHAIKLDEILEWAHGQLGFEHCGTVGDTIILRRIEPAEEPGTGEYSPNFTVKPNPRDGDQ